ncbi:hypothetical protein [Mycobacterium sp.]|uniref:hypothetical protein n=1 Tax=Mycobacterium sp. TaxID=1785 RepID=UPI00261E0AEB|nr:hypothetical protein [Mycobacterium sp.]
MSEESIATAVGFRDEPTDTGGVDTGLYGAASATMLIGYSPAPSLRHVVIASSTPGFTTAHVITNVASRYCFCLRAALLELIIANQSGQAMV